MKVIDLKGINALVMIFSFPFSFLDAGYQVMKPG